MKIAIFSDLHVHAYKEFARVLENGRNSRLEHTLKVFRRIRRYCKEHDIKYVLFGGDLFHKKHTLPVSTYQAVYEELLKFSEDKLTLVLLVGNHDQATVDGRIHALKSFGAIPRVVVADTVTEVTFDSFSVWCVPYMEDHQAFVAGMQEGERSNRILLAHGAINGAKTGPVEYQPEHPVSVDDVPMAYDFRFFGHYHKRQKMANRCWYIGSPLQHSRGEANDGEKGFLVYDTATKKFRVETLRFPEFVTLRWDGALDGVKGQFVDIHFDPEVYDGEEVSRLTLEAGAEAVNLVPIVKAPEATEERRLEVDPSMSPRKLISAYVKRYADKALRDDLVTLAKKYMEDV